MKKHLLSLAAALAIAIPSAALACKGKDGLINVTLKEGKDFHEKKLVTFVDANNENTRQKQGVITGALLLTSASEFDAKELPANKDQKLIFYCANTMCSASHEAAKRAMEAGYTSVGVLPDGIKGWKEAGLPTTKPAKASAASAQLGS